MDDQAMERGKKALKVRIGEPFKITLWEDRTHGHSWHPRFNSTPVQLVDDDYVRTIHVDTADFGKHTFEFVCSQAGQFEIVFEKQIGWKFSAEDRKVFLIEAVS